ncbi:hypothetical protein VNO78_17858 [Psophocarpus tetragonolobus]|uniref:Uncharacterized protein n=1 Tax=Psophocarpus tetragonolobus TaxID=3891 RepID=A0AAN9SJW6_PSOTE
MRRDTRVAPPLYAITLESHARTEKSYQKLQEYLQALNLVLFWYSRKINGTVPELVNSGCLNEFRVSCHVMLWIQAVCIFDPKIERTYYKLVKHTRNSSLYNSDYSSMHTATTSTSVDSKFNHSTSIPFPFAANPDTKNMAQPPSRERTLRELAAPDFTYESLCIQYPNEDVAFVLKTRLIHLLPKFHGLVGRSCILEGFPPFLGGSCEGLVVLLSSQVQQAICKLSSLPNLRTAPATKLEGKLDALVNLVTQLAANQKVAALARVYGVRTSIDHYTDCCPSLQSASPDALQAYAINIYNNRAPQQQQQQNLDLFSNRYNPGCRNQQNLRWSNQPQQQQPPPFQNNAGPSRYVPPPVQQQRQ